MSKPGKRKSRKPRKSAKEQLHVGSTTLYHATSRSAAEKVLKTGFRDATGHYLTDRLWTGVWLSNIPLDINDGPRSADVVLEVTLNKTESQLADYEWIEEGKNIREWLIPAKIVNQGKVQLQTTATRMTNPHSSRSSGISSTANDATKESRLLLLDQDQQGLVQRTTTAVRKRPEPLGLSHFVLAEVNGMKVITAPSPHTATVLRHDLPLLASEISLSRIVWVRRVGTGKTPTMQDIRAVFPCMDLYCTNDKIKELMENQSTKPRKEAEDIFVSLTGMTEKSVSRYGRERNKPTKQSQPGGTTK